MQILPTSLAAGIRPRLACEIRPESVVAARADDAAGVLATTARATLPLGALVPGLKPINIVDRVAVIAAIRRSLEDVSGKTRDITLILPDAAVRVLLLDFDSLPTKASEALPVVRFRLKKLLPFDADEAAISYQIMSTSKSLVRVLAVAIPRDILEEYESAVREAGFLPGAVLPSTLAALGALDDPAATALIVNAGEQTITTAIVQNGIVLLHRTLEVQLPIVAAEAEAQHYVETTPVGEGLDIELPIEISFEDPTSAAAAMQAKVLTAEVVHQAEAHALTHDLAQAVSVAAAYYEDTLSSAPQEVLTGGELGSRVIQQMLHDGGFNEGDLRVHEIVQPAHLTAAAVSSTIPRGLLAGVRGALRT